MTYDYGELVGRVIAGGDVEIAAAGFVRPAAGGDAPEGVLRAAWGTVVAAARQADGPEQDRLVALLGAIRELDLPDQPVLRVFGARMRQAWDVPGEPDEWARLNGFAARLTPDVVDFLLLGLWTIGTALETFAEPRVHVPAAVRWFRDAGPHLVTATIHGRTYGKAGGHGELADRAGLTGTGFTVPRWAFWRSRLEGLAKTGDPHAREGFRLIRKYDRRIAAGF